MYHKMETIKKQYYGLKYPFTNNGFQKYYCDVNTSLHDKVKSQLMHIIFTPKGQRIRNPEFGTDLIKFIFETSDEMSWDAIKNEVQESVSRWATNVRVNDIQVLKSEDEGLNDVYVKIDYSVADGNKTTRDTIAIQL